MKKSIALLLVLCLLVPMMNFTVSAASNTTIFIRPKQFENNTGTWEIKNDQKKGAILEVLIGVSGGNSSETLPASICFDLPQAGQYTVWGLTRDFTDVPGNRYCNLEVNGKFLDTIIGNTGIDEWTWVKAGVLDLPKGETTVNVLDTGAYTARLQGIILTTDKNLVPPTDHSGMKTLLDATNLKIIEKEVIPFEMKEDKTYIALSPESFAVKGNFTVVSPNDAGGYLTSYLKGDTSKNPSPNTPAIQKIVIPKDGNYRIFALSRGYANDTSRYYDVALGGSKTRFGMHGVNGWRWEVSEAIPLFSGEYDLKLIDSSGNYARFGMLLVTDDEQLNFGRTDAEYKFLKKNLYTDGMYKVAEKSSVPDADRPNTEIAVKLNGKYMQFDVDPVLMNDRTMVPFRAIFEALGCNVSWDGDNEIASGSRNGHVVELTIDNNVASVNGNSVVLDQAATLLNGRTMVPLRFVSEALNAAVDWNDATQTVSIMANIPEEVYWLRPSSFSILGTWNFDKAASGAFENTAFMGMATGSTLAEADASSAEPAIADFSVAKSGEYNVWVRSRDFAENQQGHRYFNISVNGTLVEHKFGTHAGDGYKWVKAPVKVTLNSGANQVQLLDTSGFYARCDSILFTQNDDFVPSENLLGMEAVALPLQPADRRVEKFPKHATELNTPTESAVIENGKTKVVFYKVPTSQGQVVQNEIYSKDASDNWVLTNARSEELGHFVLRADKASVKTSADMLTYDTMWVAEDGTEKPYFGANPYLAGRGMWAIPVDYTQNGNTVVLHFADVNGAKLSSEWTLEQDNPSPLVSATVTALSDGYYSLAQFEGGEFTENEFSDAVAPFRVIDKRVHEEICALSEQFLFTPMGCYTLYENNKYSSQPITKGIVTEGTYIPQRWVYGDNTILGINMKSPTGGFRGTLFAPNIGSDASKLTANQSHTVKYRIISSVSDWFSNYKFVVSDLFDVNDYRQNTHTTLNQAIFNTRKLVLDDTYGGWDNNMIGHYNMEAVNTVSEANPMQAVQDYLLSEDEEMLERRAIPTLAAFLTRPSLHFNPATYEYGSTTNWEKRPKDPDSIGTPKTGYNINVTAGLYEMTGGNVPYLYELGLTKGKGTVKNEYGSVAPFSNNLNLYIYTGDQKYLDSAIQQADDYLKNVVYAETTDLPLWEKFIYVSYYPNIGSLMDIYDVTKDQKYLDAAEYVAQMMLTGLWVPGIEGDRKTEQVQVNNIDGVKTGDVVIPSYRYGKKDSYTTYWHGEDQFRIGDHRTKETFHDPIYQAEQTAPGWMYSRVGLGLEQASTFDDDSSNIIMQYWAGDFMRLSAYTGEEMFANAARNAMVGRFSNYSGYYQSFLYTLQYKENYPYEGPDYSGIYWHHLPPFLAMIEEFLISQSMAWSDFNIEFPALRQQGYAYFNSHQYGHKPGKFYDQTEMWPYLAENTIDSGHLQIDWMAARKDGMLGVALMNESAEDVTTTVSLLDGIPGGTSYTGPATVFDKAGNKTQINVENGKFEITVPAKGLKAVTIAIPEIKAPAFAKNSYTLDGNYTIGATASVHTNGKGYVLQISPENYFAYVYVTSKPSEVTKVNLTYTAGDKTETLTDTEYPYEFIVKVDNPEDKFVYTLSAFGTDYKEIKLGGSTLMPRALSEKLGAEYSDAVVDETVSVTEQTVKYKGSKKNFEPVPFVYKRHGSSDTEFRFVLQSNALDNAGKTQNDLVGLPIAGIFTAKGMQKYMYSVITAVEYKNDEIVVSVAETPEILTAEYGTTGNGSDHKFVLYVYPNGTKMEAIDFKAIKSFEETEETSGSVKYEGSGKKFEPFVLAYERQGHDRNGSFKFVVPKDSFKGVDATKKELCGLTVKGVVTDASGEKEFSSVITDVEDRSDSLVLVIPETEDVICTEYNDSTSGAYQFKLNVYPYEK